MSRIALLLFARFPVPGRVKTRLAASTSDGFAADLYRRCLTLLVRSLDTVPARRVVWVADAQDLDCMRELVGPGWEVHPQPVGDLSGRLNTAFAEAFGAGAERVLVTATDTPALDPGLLAAAIQVLDERDAVLGPATDGGYYLLGLRSWPVPVFEGVDWSTEVVAAQTRDHLHAAGCSWLELPYLADVDTEADLRAFMRDHPEHAVSAWVRADGRLG